MNTRLTTLKTALWALCGMAFVLTLARFGRGLGATTNLTDVSPWGLWIAFDIMAGVALAAGGFVLAAAVYIFGLERYREFARPAILTAFLGYTAVAVGLMYDLGLPWHVWHLLISPQPTSVLFEVGMCVMLYLTVLLCEFGPVILEHPWFDKPLLQKIHHGLKKITIPLVIMGIVLSSLHQSSLGSLFLIVPHRLHALWYSPIMWILFLVSAIGLGLMMVVAESIFSSFFFGHKIDTRKLGGLGRAASFVLLFYAGLRIIDLAVRGKLALAFDGSWQANLFLFEILFSTLVPAILLMFRSIRERTLGLGLIAAMVVLGMIGYRFDVCLVAFMGPEGSGYFPSWMEFGVSVGIIAGFMLVFIFFVQYFKVYSDDHSAESEDSTDKSPAPGYHPSSPRWMLPLNMLISRRVTMAAVFGAALTAAILPSHVWSGDVTIPTPTQSVRHLPAWTGPAGDLRGQIQVVLDDGIKAQPADSHASSVMLIDGNRDGRAVTFWHEGHAQRLGGNHACGTCHHQNLPLDRTSACSKCHADMYLEFDIFDHFNHVEKLGDNASCQRCHLDPEQPKARDKISKCGSCHENMLAKDSRIPPGKDGMKGFAPGYMDSMHGLCIKCHEDLMSDAPSEIRKDFAQCVMCHQEQDPSALKAHLPLSSLDSE